MEGLKLNSSFLTLVRLGIGTSKNANIPNDVDWNELKALAEKQELSAIVLDGIDALQSLSCSKGLSSLSTDSLPLETKLEWIGEVHQFYEQRHEQYLQAISDLAKFYNSHGFKMMVLKGYACSLNWPKPEHRPCGDIDIWLFGQQKEADAALTAWFKGLKVKGFKIDNSHHHHSVFYWHDFMVENHYDFINVYHHKSNVAFEKILKKLAADSSHSIEMCGEKVYLPSPNLHALYLLKHTMMHFAAEGITLRQLLDWAFLVKAHGKDVNWEWLEGVLDDFGMRRLYDIFNAICVENLGFDVRLFSRVQFEPTLKDKVLKEILSPEYSEGLPSNTIMRSFYKLRRWIGNAWKHDLCYKESMWSAFWSGLVNHLLKPSSI